ncbi:MAG: hypothetical protein WC188_02205 [Candidatus Caldatribacteriota bacterium]
MIQLIDLNATDSIYNMITFEKIIDKEEYSMNENIIIDQYSNFNNLGINFIDNIDNEFKPSIFENMLEYVNDTYMSIVDYDSAMLLPQKLLESGQFIYEFVCVDCFNTIIPNFLSSLNCNNLENFDFLVQNRFKYDYSLIKANLVKIIKNIVEELLKLQKIDSNVRNDNAYKKLLFKFTYYMELLDFGDTEKFVNNYIRPVLIKNLDSILWRIS